MYCIFNQRSVFLINVSIFNNCSVFKCSFYISNECFLVFLISSILKQVKFIMHWYDTQTVDSIFNILSKSSLFFEVLLQDFQS